VEEQQNVMADHYDLTQTILLPAYRYMAAVLRIRIRDLGAFLTSGSGIRDG
jgi:hypothetical protein